MPSSVTLSNRQRVGAGISILDQDGQPFAEKPPGATVAFSSSDPAVAGIVVAEDGLNIEVSSGLVGQAVITASVTLSDSTSLSDTLSVAVQNSLPGSLNFTVGTPSDEA